MSVPAEDSFGPHSPPVVGSELEFESLAGLKSFPGSDGAFVLAVACLANAAGFLPDQSAGRSAAGTIHLCVERLWPVAKNAPNPSPQPSRWRCAENTTHFDRR